MKAFFQKLTSRKFIVTAVIVAIGLAIALGVNASTIDRLIGAVTSLVSGVCYLVAEGKIDVARIQNVIEKAQEVAETIEEAKDEVKEGE